MNARIHVLTGARAGLTVKLQWSEFALGRHPDSALQFHPALDLEVSICHAVILPIGGQWWIRDLDSRNGTFVNGRRITSDTLLAHGDRITLGRTGPSLEFDLVGLPSATVYTPPQGEAQPAPVRGEANPAPRDAGAAPAATAVQSRRLGWFSAVLTVALLLAVAVGQLREQRQHSSWARERQAMQSRIDSLMLASDRSAQALEGMLGGLLTALRQSQEEVRLISEDLRRAEERGDRPRMLSLRRRLETASATLDAQQLVAAIDFRSIERRNRRAVAKVYVEYDDGEVATATAFAVRPDATLLTSRHVIADERRVARRVAIQFVDSDQIWPARVLMVANDADLALVKVDNIVGRVPTVHALNTRSDTVAKGAAVVLVGFPLGGQTGRMDDTAPHYARPTLTAGVVRTRRPNRLEVHGYGAAGASGSPIFDANGEVIAVLFGGRRDANGDQTLFGVPAGFVLRLLESTP